MTQLESSDRTQHIRSGWRSRWSCRHRPRSFLSNLSRVFVLTILMFALFVSGLTALSASGDLKTGRGPATVEADIADSNADDGDTDDDGNEPPGEPVRLVGVVESLPIGALLGSWTISQHTVVVNAQTEIDISAVLTLGVTVVVKGNLQDNSVIHARKIELEDDAGDSGEIEFSGIVVSLPKNSSGEGEWRIRGGLRGVRSVIADTDTELDMPLPSIGRWVEVRGTLQSDDTILASKIRLDNYEDDEVVVRLSPGADPEELADRHDLELRQTLLASANIHLYTTTDDEDDEASLVDQLQENDAVLWAELNYTSGIPQADPYDTWAWGGPDPSAYEKQYAFEQVRLAPAGSLYQGQEVTVAVIDTGVSLDHPQMESRLLPGRDLVDDDEVADEEGGGLGWGHGTHVAGIIAHMAPESDILPVRVLDANGRGNSFIVAYAVEWAVDQGADVINLSLGSGNNSQVLRDVMYEAWQQGVVIVAAAGNDNQNSLQYPAAYTTTIAVTAVDAADRKAEFANYGKWIDIAAPGVGITSTVVGPEGNGYASWSGTSMATSFVSGASAMGRQRMASATPAQIVALWIDGGVDLDTANPDYSGLLGNRLDVSAALIPQEAEVYLPDLRR